MAEPSAFGFLNIDKPPQLTSHDVVARVRRAFGIKKVGHAGTLDPMATGVLIVCVGTATRLSEYVMHATKRYRARVHLGIVTDTYDAEGTIQATHDASHITRPDLEKALSAFLGDIEQIPPMYSAIKRGGRKLYELARAGETVDLEARSVTIEALTLVDWSPPVVTLDVTCSPGTYIRSLAYDLGESLAVGAYLAGLTRTASGAFTLENAIALDSLLDGDPRQKLIPVDVALAHFPLLHLDEQASQDILQGRPLPDAQAAEGTLARAHDSSGNFIALLKANNGNWRPHKVFLQRD